MRGGICFGPVDFDEHKLRRIIPLLNKVESHDARLLYAVASVFDGCLAESFHAIWFYLDEDMDDEHG